MKISSIQLINFKNISDAVITFKSNLSGIYGTNGSGKTSIIEALDLCHVFFNYKRDNETSRYRKNVLKYIKNAQDTMQLSVVLHDNLTEYMFDLGFTVHDGELSLTKERIQSRRYNSKNIWNDRFNFEKDVDKILPIIKLNNTKLDIEEKSYGSTIMTNSSNYNSISYYAIRNRLFEDDSIQNELETLIQSFRSMSIISINEQALCNFNMLIVMHAHLKDANGSFAVGMRE